MVEREWEGRGGNGKGRGKSREGERKGERERNKNPLRIGLVTGLLTLPRQRCSSETISVKFLSKGHRWPRYQKV